MSSRELVKNETSKVKQLWMMIVKRCLSAREDSVRRTVATTATTYPVVT